MPVSELILKTQRKDLLKRVFVESLSLNRYIEKVNYQFSYFRFIVNLRTQDACDFLGSNKIHKLIRNVLIVKSRFSPKYQKKKLIQILNT